jgi:hypothetical protein
MPQIGKKKAAKFRPPIGEPKFLYFSLCHNRQAKKPALRAVGSVSRSLGAAPDTSEQTEGLGGWRCGDCGKPCEVTRTKNPALREGKLPE